MTQKVPWLDRRQWLRAATLGACWGAFGGRGGAASRPMPARLSSGEPDWTALSELFRIEEGLIYMNAGTYGPSLSTVDDAEHRERAAMSRDWLGYFASHHLGDAMPRLVDHVARFVGASVDGVALVSGTTEAMNIVASGLDLTEADEVLTTTHEHQAGIYPWLLAAKRRRCAVRQMAFPSPATSDDDIVERFEAAIGPRTRVLSFCHVHYTDGTILPVRRLCDLARRKGILSVVDGAQAVGMLDFRVADLGCDIYATSLHKWLSGPYGTGLLWIRRDVQDRVWPSVVEGYDGWDTVDRYGDRPTAPGRDFVGAWPPAMQKYAWAALYAAPLIWALVGAIEFQEQVGRARIEARSRSLAARLRKGLEAIPGIDVVTPARPGMSGGIVAFRMAGVIPRAFSSELRREHRIVIRNVTHEHIGFAANRVCTHVWNTEDQVERLLAVLRARAAR